MMVVMAFAFLSQLARDVVAQLVAGAAEGSKLILRQTRGQLGVQGLAFLANAVKVRACLTSPIPNSRFSSLTGSPTRATQKQKPATLSRAADLRYDVFKGEQELSPPPSTRFLPEALD